MLENNQGSNFWKGISIEIFFSSKINLTHLNIMCERVSVCKGMHGVEEGERLRDCVCVCERERER